MKRRKDKSILDMCGKLTAPPGVHVRIEEMNAWPTETDAEDAELLAKVREAPAPARPGYRRLHRGPLTQHD